MMMFQMAQTEVEGNEELNPFVTFISSEIQYDSGTVRADQRMFIM
jgi:hypothetical protein